MAVEAKDEAVAKDVTVADKSLVARAMVYEINVNASVLVVHESTVIVGD